MFLKEKKLRFNLDAQKKMCNRIKLIKSVAGSDVILLISQSLLLFHCHVDYHANNARGDLAPALFLLYDVE